jgi:hypothetical protein
MGEQFEDFGPEPAVYLVQDAAGNWQRVTPDSPPPDQSGWQYALYLAPDRLLYGGQHAVPLAAIRRVDMHAVGRLNPFPENLLKIEFAYGDGGTRVIGFLLPNAGDCGRPRTVDRCPGRLPRRASAARRVKGNGRGRSLADSRGSMKAALCTGGVYFS